MGSGDDSVLDKYVCEFVGTFLLVLTVVCNVINGNQFGALSIACVLMVAIYSMGQISGAHFNPAVTLAVTVCNKMDGGWPRAIIYMIVQVVAGALGAVSGFALYNYSFSLAPAPGFQGAHACIVEFFFTTMLAFVVLNTACCKTNHNNQYYGLAIGFVIVAGGYAAGPVSGGCLNPAVALGIDIGGLGKHPFGWSIVYTIVQLIGGLFAALCYRVVRPEEFEQTPEWPWHKYFAEFIGTFYLVFTVGLNVLAGTPTAALSIAATLMCMVYALGSCSGAHFNPAVTVAVLLSGRNMISGFDAAIYIVMQILGGITASLLYYGVYGRTFPLEPQGVHNWGSVCAAEIFFTGLLCFVVLNVATTREGVKEFYGFAIGMCVTVGGYAIGGVSGGSLNPAVSVGIDTVHAIASHGKFVNCLAYSGVEVIGAMIAAGLFYIVRLNSEYDPKKQKN